MSNATTQQVSSHWSKDFVEHLRTVHFSLITVSAALILFAYRVSNQVSEMLQLREKWGKVQGAEEVRRLYPKRTTASCMRKSR
jgi:hypothetical protein